MRRKFGVLDIAAEISHQEWINGRLLLSKRDSLTGVIDGERSFGEALLDLRLFADTMKALVDAALAHAEIDDLANEVTVVLEAGEHCEAPSRRLSVTLERRGIVGQGPWTLTVRSAGDPLERAVASRTDALEAFTAALVRTLQEWSAEVEFQCDATFN